ncbi:YeeE/YedE family protein [Rhodovulum adriaticum]|uniref:Sulfur transporter n=1 Tax=Rhodovulum adriaticum TaxID=35804 RepID=A0A4R2NWB1_RHOAD|nr:YeeE/YedE family protein [Rhodovulum adriaticum]MBK1636266.1 YeeE/YedE family protein [Rhodovulum adriaticum]TCP26267.1 sulfur transporter [Rhodovulum adriaticum]
MFADFGFDTLTAPDLVPYLGLAIGLAFGALAEITGFCFRRAVTGPAETRRPALGIWMAALATAILGTQAAAAAGLIAFEGHRLHSPDLALAALLTGGVLFGAGMVLTRGCISRLTVLGGSGNLRALLVLVVFAIVAHATLKGVLAPLRTALGAWTLPVGDYASLAALPGPAFGWALVLAAGAAALACCSGAPRGRLALAALLGLLVPAAWVGTGFVLYDDFDPVPLTGLSFTAPAAETLFWGVAATAIKPTFGVGLLGGVLAGAAISARLSGRFRWQSFDSPAQTGRYMGGAVLMGIGGVLAGGCTVGAGLAGIPTLSLAAVLALAAIAVGARATQALLSAPSSGVSAAT